MPNRTLPSNLAAEASVLGCVMLEPRSIHDVLARLRESDFYKPLHRDVLEAMGLLVTKGQAIDPLTVASQMKWRGWKGDEGELQDQLVNMMKDAPAVASLPSYVEEVADTSRLRQMIALASQYQEEAFNAEDDADSLLTRFETDVFALTSKRSVREDFPSAVRRTIANIEARANDPRDILGVESGILGLDRITEGWQPGHLITVAGTTGTGKTAWAINNCVLAAARKKIPCLIFTFEMLNHELIERMLGAATGLESRRLRKGRLETKDEWTQVYSAGSLLQELPIEIIDTKLNIAQVASEVRRFRANERFFPRRSAEEEAQGLPGLVIVDYLQLIAESGKKGQTREREVASFSGTLKAIAQSTRLPVMELSQLSREHLKRDNKRPILPDLKESGSIEQDSDIIIFLYREALYGDDPEKPAAFKDDAELIVAKNRHGDIGTVHAKFDRPTMRYYATSENQGD